MVMRCICWKFRQLSEKNADGILALILMGDYCKIRLGRLFLLKVLCQNNLIPEPALLSIQQGNVLKFLSCVCWVLACFSGCHRKSMRQEGSTKLAWWRWILGVRLNTSTNWPRPSTKSESSTMHKWSCTKKSSKRPTIPRWDSVFTQLFDVLCFCLA